MWEDGGGRGGRKEGGEDTALKTKNPHVNVGTYFIDSIGLNRRELFN